MTPETAPTPPPPAQGDDRDWTVVITEGCAECGYRPLDLAGLGAWFTAQASRWDVLVPGTPGRPDPSVRPEPQVWSPLEYGAHVRDMLAVLAQRVEAMLGQSDPELADWDGDAKAVELGYFHEDPAAVRDAIHVNARRVEELLAGLTPEQWERTGRRSDGMSFTVAGMSRYIAHEMEHHLQDAGA